MRLVPKSHALAHTCTNYAKSGFYDFLNFICYLNHTSIDILLLFGCSDHYDSLIISTTFKRSAFLSNRHNVTTMLNCSFDDTLLWRFPDVFHVYDDQIKFYWFPIAAKQNNEP